MPFRGRALSEGQAEKNRMGKNLSERCLDLLKLYILGVQGLADFKGEKTTSVAPMRVRVVHVIVGPGINKP